MKPLAFLITLLVVGSIPALADEDRHTFRAELSGYNEVVPAGGAVSTAARGKFKAHIDEDAQTIHYELSYEDLEFPVAQAHIHFGQRHTSGGISVRAGLTYANVHSGTGGAQPVGFPSGEIRGQIHGDHDRDD